MMRNFKFILAFLMYLCLTGNINSQAAKEKERFNWDRVIEAIIQVESRGNPNAFNKEGNCAGILQITKICVKEANNILKEKGYERRFSLSDRWDEEKSREIFLLIQEKYNPEHDLVKACRIWNEGPNFNKKIETTEYVNKVMKNLL